jgi:LPXTG-site transpeptidase (sortase) family protein
MIAVLGFDWDWSSPQSSPPEAPAVAEPVRVDIPAIDAHSTLIPLGLNPDDTVEVPDVKKPQQAGWYRYSVRPGEDGPAILLGHVDGGGKRGIFHDLRKLKPGDEVVVTGADGTSVTFAMTRVQEIPKAKFPTEAVYGDTDQAELRLITCGGSFDKKARSYRDSVIAYAALK